MATITYHLHAASAMASSRYRLSEVLPFWTKVLVESRIQCRDIKILSMMADAVHELAKVGL